MGKCVFKEFNINLHKKEYKVLVPGRKLECMFVELWETIYKQGDWDYCIVDRVSLKLLRAAYMELYKNPYTIIYFPIREIEHICKHRFTAIPPDLIMYTHQRQLKRKDWKKIKRCLKYIKGRPYVVRFHVPEMTKTYEQMMRQWKKHHSFYPFRQRDYLDEERLRYQYETCFLETSKRQALYTAISIQKALETDLEGELELYLYHTAGSRLGGLSYEFATKEFLRRREAEGWG